MNGKGEIWESPWLIARRADWRLGRYTERERDTILDCAQSLAGAMGMGADVALDHLLYAIQREAKNAKGSRIR